MENTELTLESKIEGLLFFKGEEMSFSEVAKILGEKTEAVEEAILKLSSSLTSRGLELIKKDDKVILGTAKEMAPVLEKMRKEELAGELSRASLEVLSIVLYKNGATRSEVDYIRGVNSSFTIRNLLLRGLVEKITDPKDQRRFIYKPTFELLAFMGLSSVEDLPDYAQKKQILDRKAEITEEVSAE